MKTITALDGQSLFDIALAAYGRAELAFDIALANDMSLSDDPAPRQVLNIPIPQGKTDPAVADFYLAHAINPATAPDPDEIDALNPEGISFWFIKSPLPAFSIGG